MNIDAIPIGIVFLATLFGVMLSIEVGYRLGHLVDREAEDKKEALLTTVTGSILGLVALMLAFTFGSVFDRYDARKALVRDEANAIGTLLLRSDFLPEPYHSEANELLKQYLDHRLAVVKSFKSYDYDQVQKVLSESILIQRKLWDISVVNARKDVHSVVAALYIESLNELVDLHALRMAVAVQRVPVSIWFVLCALVILSMFRVGYHKAIITTKRSWATPILAISFSIVITLIVSLDSHSRYITVSQQPLVDLRNSLAPFFEDSFRP